MTSGARRRPVSIVRRGGYALIAIVAVVTVGTLGVHYLEGWNMLDSFYFTSMIATAQGPANVPATEGGKIFVALLSFVSVGTVVTSLILVFGPFFSLVVREGVEEVEKEFGRGNLRPKPQEDDAKK